MESVKQNGVGFEKRTVLFNEALTLTGFGLYNIILLVAGGGCIMCVIIETMNMAFISPAAQCDLNLTDSEKGILASIAFIGVCTSSHFWGFIADTRGRKRCLIIGLIGAAIFTFISSFVPWGWLFILLRFLNGFFVAPASSVSLAWIGELHNNHYRPMLISWISAFVAAGQMYIPGLAWAILPHDWSYEIALLGIAFRPWRLTLIVYGLPSLIVALLVWFLPESPKYLLSQGRHEETLQILSRIYTVNNRKKPDSYPVSKIVLDEIPAEANVKNVGIIKSLWEQTVPLFKREYIIQTMILCYMQFGVFVSATSLQLWFPQILASMNRYSNEVSSTDVKLCNSATYDRAENVDLPLKTTFEAIFKLTNESNSLDVGKCDDSIVSDAFIVNLCVAVGIGATYVTQGIVINKVGKEILLIALTTVTGLCGITAQYISGYMTILVLVGIFLLMSSGVGLVANFVVEVYPTNIRAMGIAISLLFGRMGAAMGSNAVGPLFYSHCDYLFIMFLINHIIIIVCVLTIPKPKNVEKLNIEEPSQL